MDGNQMNGAVVARAASPGTGPDNVRELFPGGSEPAPVRNLENVQEIFPGASGMAPVGARGWLAGRWSASVRWLRRDAGMATAEYAIATLAAVGFAGLLVVILKSSEVRGMLMNIIRAALSF